MHLYTLASMEVFEYLVLLCVTNHLSVPFKLNPGHIQYELLW